MTVENKPNVYYDYRLEFVFTRYLLGGPQWVFKKYILNILKKVSWKKQATWQKTAHL